ncbi:agmatine deiminase family protein [Amycolatopsis anabasis]|uniref:agmatine deiminase family protein n=1 Tax=Amycolatopsis anabasis TaxID=1840409 RepID=UPI00131CC600|nr:agmatine deiminase family protein [Amycolatopsis anabasis]
MAGMSRRSMLCSSALAMLGAGCAPVVSTPGYRMPGEWHPHERTFLAWPAREEVWGRELPRVRQDVAALARAIAEFEPVRLCARPDQVPEARRQCGTGAIEVVPVPVDDLWMRDTGPNFVLGPGGLAGVDLNFNGWGGKQRHDEDTRVAGRILEALGVPHLETPLVGEGGCLEVDGEGTLLVTESSLVNDNRNPGRSRAEIEQRLRDLLGVRTVLWFAGVRGHDITDGHVDCLVRFTHPGQVVLNRPAESTPPDNVWARASEEARAVLREARDAAGRRLEVVELAEAEDVPEIDTFLASYVNYYVANGAIIMPRFGDGPADDRAAGVLRELHPGRRVVPVDIRHLAAGGGGIHCATQQQPRVPR